jgi:hypothetical protein
VASKQGICAACRNPEARNGFHADWMSSIPDGMTRNTVLIVTALEQGNGKLNLLKPMDQPPLFFVGFVVDVGKGEQFFVFPFS